MKRVLIILALASLVAASASAQFRVSAVQGVGSLLQEGESPMLASYTAAAFTIVKDTSSNLVFYDKTGTFYSDPDVGQTEFRGFFTEPTVRVYIPVEQVTLYLDLGGKVAVQSLDGPDKAAYGVGLAFGIKVAGDFGFQLGADWIGREGPDGYLLSGAVDLLPIIK